MSCGALRSTSTSQSIYYVSPNFSQRLLCMYVSFPADRPPRPGQGTLRRPTAARPPLPAQAAQVQGPWSTPVIFATAATRCSANRLSRLWRWGGRSLHGPATSWSWTRPPLPLNLCRRGHAGGLGPSGSPALPSHFCAPWKQASKSRSTSLYSVVMCRALLTVPLLLVPSMILIYS